MSNWFFFDSGLTLSGTISHTQNESGYVHLRIESEDQLYFVECTQSASTGLIEAELVDELEGCEVEFTPAVEIWGDGQKLTWKLTEKSLEDMDAVSTDDS